MNLRELAGVIERNDRGKQDLEARSNEIRVSENRVLIIDGKQMWPNDWVWYIPITRVMGGKACQNSLDNTPSMG